MPTPEETIAALQGRRRYPVDDPIAGWGQQPPAATHKPFDWQRMPKERLDAIGALLTAVPRAVYAGATFPGEGARRAYQGNAPGPEETFQGAQNVAGLIGGGGFTRAATGRAAGELGTAGGAIKTPAAKAEVAPTFYSPAERALAGAKQAKSTPQHWEGWLRNQPGVKQEELAALGLEHLPDEAMMRADLLAHIQGKQVKLGEVNKGMSLIDPPTREELAQFAQEQYGRNYADLNLRQQQGLIEDIQDFRGVKDLSSEPKFAKYQLPGATNYGEKLLTLPHKGASNVFDVAYLKVNQLPNGTWNIVDKASGRVPEGFEEAIGGPGFAYQTGAERYLEKLTFGRETLPSVRTHVDTGKVDYHSSHWDEPNVLVHIRHNDRALPPLGDSDAPRRALHLEEIQSDWHQAGRKQGYESERPTAEAELAAKKEQADFMDAMDKKYPGTIGTSLWRSSFSPEDAAKYEQLVNKRDVLMEARAKPPGVPDAPFKTTWPDLALKRMVRQAAEGGYDALSWTPGEAQAARYDLSKQVNKLAYQPDTQQLSIHLSARSGGGVQNKNVPPDKLPEFVGKDVAERLLNAPKSEDLKGQGWHWLTDEKDLKVGGEGMRAFYDKMLVDKANALGRKYGAKVTQESVGPEPATFFVKDGYINGEEGMMAETTHGEMLKDGWYHHPERDVNGVGPFKTEAEAKKAGATGALHVLPITPELRKAALEQGFPLYSAGPGAAPALAAQQPAEQPAPAPEGPLGAEAYRALLASGVPHT